MTVPAVTRLCPNISRVRHLCGLFWRWNLGFWPWSWTVALNASVIDRYLCKTTIQICLFAQEIMRKAIKKVLRELRKNEYKSDNVSTSTSTTYRTAKDSLPSRMSNSSFNTAFNPEPRTPLATQIVTMDLKNSEEINFKDVEQSLERWTIPKIPVEQIYIGSFEDTSDFMIQTVERTYSSQDEAFLFLLDDKEKYDRLKMRYNYLHICLVQIGIKPLTRKGLNIPCLTL